MVANPNINEPTAKEAPTSERFKEVLKELFAKYNRGGEVSFHYQTEVYFGKI